jgi:hypothetical protein
MAERSTESEEASMRHRIAPLSVLILIVLAASAAAQTPPLGSEFQVNSYTTSDQYGYGIAMDQSGNFVISWESYDQDGDSYASMARRFDGAGAPRGAEFQVNVDTTGDQGYPAVSSDAAGNFVVVWEVDADGSGAGVTARRFDKAGNALGGEFTVNTFTTGAQVAPQVASDPGGNFVVVWVSVGQDGDQAGIFARRFDNAGVALGAGFPVNSHTTGDQLNPVVAMGGAGEFVVVWRGAGPTSTDAVFARRYSSLGVAQGTEFRVNTSPTPAYPAVAMDRSGGFVVVWEGTVAGGSGVDAVARRFNSAGLPLSAEFRVNTSTLADQISPAVAIDPTGNFLVAWESPALDGDAMGIFGQRFDRLGNLVGAEFQVNEYTTGQQVLPRVATSVLGNFAVAWTSEAQDGDSFGVFARTSALSAATSFQVDAHASTGTSDLNGILEPGETVLVEPGWRNRSATGQTFTGSAPSLTGPAGATYGLDDATADYGTVAAGASANCFDATGDCYEVTVSNPAVRPATHWDALLQENLSAATPKTWPLHVGESFTDVPPTQLFYRRIEAVLHAGITTGCTTTTYCPGDPVTRSQMSLFLGRGVAGSGPAMPTSGTVGGNPYNCTVGGTSLFTDVLPTASFCRSVHYLAAQNVTTGCSPTQYCPNPNVTRLEMSTFVARAVVAPAGGAGVPLTYGPDPVTGFSYSCDTGSPDIHFTDVPASNDFCKHAHFLWARGIISGCSETEFCPNDSVTRDQMARFLGNGFNAQAYGP